MKVSVVINLGMTPSSSDLHVDEGGEQRCFNFESKRLVEKPDLISSGLNITRLKLIERGSTEIQKVAAWWKEALNMTFF